MSRSVAILILQPGAGLQPVRGNRLAKKLISLAAARSLPAGGRTTPREMQSRGQTLSGKRRASGPFSSPRVEGLFLPLIHFAACHFDVIHHDLAIALDLYPTVHAGRIRCQSGPEAA